MPKVLQSRNRQEKSLMGQSELRNLERPLFVHSLGLGVAKPSGEMKPMQGSGSLAALRLRKQKLENTAKCLEMEFVRKLRAGCKKPCYRPPGTTHLGPSAHVFPFCSACLPSCDALILIPTQKGPEHSNRNNLGFITRLLWKPKHPLEAIRAME